MPHSRGWSLLIVGLRSSCFQSIYFVLLKFVKGSTVFGFKSLLWFWNDIYFITKLWPCHSVRMRVCVNFIQEWWGMQFNVDPEQWLYEIQLFNLWPMDCLQQSFCNSLRPLFGRYFGDNLMFERCRTKRLTARRHRNANAKINCIVWLLALSSWNHILLSWSSLIKGQKRSDITHLNNF